MNASHIIGKKRNRIKRCQKRLSSAELTSVYKSATGRITTRIK